MHEDVKTGPSGQPIDNCMKNAKSQANQACTVAREFLPRQSLKSNQNPARRFGRVRHESVRIVIKTTPSIVMIQPTTSQTVSGSRKNNTPNTAAIAICDA